MLSKLYVCLLEVESRALSVTEAYFYVNIYDVNVKM